MRSAGETACSYAVSVPRSHGDAPFAKGARRTRPLPGAGRSPARLAPPAVGAAPRFAQGSSRAPCGRPCAPLRCFAPSGRPFPCPGGATLAAGRPRSLCLGRRPGCGWGAAVPPCPPRCARFAPSAPLGGLCRPPLRAGFLWRFAPPEEKGVFVAAAAATRGFPNSALCCTASRGSLRGGHCN